MPIVLEQEGARARGLDVNWTRVLEHLENWVLDLKMMRCLFGGPEPRIWLKAYSYWKLKLPLRIERIDRDIWWLSILCMNQS